MMTQDIVQWHRHRTGTGYPVEYLVVMVIILTVAAFLMLFSDQILNSAGSVVIGWINSLGGAP